MTDSYLAHYGVKGMHWGVRKERDSTYAVAPKEGSAPDPRRYRNWEKAGQRSVGRTLREVGYVGVSAFGGAFVVGNLAPTRSSKGKERAFALAGAAAGGAGGAKFIRAVNQHEKTVAKVQDNRRSMAAGRGVVWKTDKTPEEIGELGKVKAGDLLKAGAKNVLLGPAGIIGAMGEVTTREVQRGLENQTHIASGKVKIPR